MSNEEFPKDLLLQIESLHEIDKKSWLAQLVLMREWDTKLTRDECGYFKALMTTRAPENAFGDIEVEWDDTTDAVLITLAEVNGDNRPEVFDNVLVPYYAVITAIREKFGEFELIDMQLMPATDIQDGDKAEPLISQTYDVTYDANWFLDTLRGGLTSTSELLRTLPSA